MKIKKISNHALMSNNITQDDINKVINFLKKKPILTQNKKVKEFEKKWSKWLGVKYSVFVNSGSSANFLTIAALKNFTNKKQNKLNMQQHRNIKHKIKDETNKKI